MPASAAAHAAPAEGLYGRHQSTRHLGTPAPDSAISGTLSSYGTDSRRQRSVMMRNRRGPTSVLITRNPDSSYLGRTVDSDKKAKADYTKLHGPAATFVTHAVCVGMTGSGKTGLVHRPARGSGHRRRARAGDRSEGRPRRPAAHVPESRLRSDFRAVDRRRRRAARTGKSPGRVCRSAGRRCGRKGLASWGQDGERIARLREAADFAIYTPGSQSGLPLSIIKSFAAPRPTSIGDADLMRERVATTATSLAGAAWASTRTRSRAASTSCSPRSHRRHVDARGRISISPR